MNIYLENIKNPDIRFKVMSYDKETKQAKLKGGYGAEFTRDISKVSLEKFGYKLVKTEKELPLVSAPKEKAAPKAASKVKVKAKATEEEEEEEEEEE